MLIPLIMLLPRRMIGTSDSFLAVADASRIKSHLNQIMAANRNKMMPMDILNASIAPHQSAPNARINTIAVATILLITVNLRRKTVRFTTPEIYAPAWFSTMPVSLPRQWGRGHADTLPN